MGLYAVTVYLDDNMTQQQVADSMGISRQRVQQLEVKGLRKVKQALERRGITAKSYGDWVAEEPVQVDRFSEIK